MYINTDKEKDIYTEILRMGIYRIRIYTQEGDIQDIGYILRRRIYVCKYIYILDIWRTNNIQFPLFRP